MSISSCTSKTVDEDIVIEKKVVEKPKDLVLEKLLDMTLDEKIGQLFIGGIDGNLELTPNDVALIKDRKIGGAIFFRRNISNSSQTINLINQIKKLSLDSGNIPMFLSLDQEGGVVTRLPEEIVKFPRASIIGEKNDTNYAYEVSSLMSEVVASLGFNMNFSPVLDILTNPKNTVIGSRAFSSNKEIVSVMATTYMNSSNENGVVAVGKHFPGHGDTFEDSHYELPLVKHDYERIKEVELYPFQYVIDSGLDVMLVGHLMYENIDPDNITTMSKIFIDDILRREMDFRGVVITDDMIMKGITNSHPIEEASLKALKAGVDIVLIGSGYENIIKSMDRVKSAVLNGEMDEFDLDRKVYRILKLKEKFKVNNEEILDINILEINSKINTLINN